MKFDCAYDELLQIDSKKIMPNPRNNNRHSIEQIERLAKIIDFQGQRSPIVISNRSGYIVKGHCRLEAIKKLGWTEIAIDYQDYLTEAQEYADMMADNEIARWSELDIHKTIEDLKGLDLGDLELLGLEDSEVLMGNFNEPDKLDVEGEEVFDKELDEKSQYVVIYTDSKEEFKEMREKFKIETVTNHLSPNPDNRTHRIRVINRLLDYSNIKELFK